MARRSTACDSLACTLAILAVIVALVFFRNKTQQLLRYLFWGFIIGALILVLRHVFFRLAYRVRVYRQMTRPQPDKEREEKNPEFDSAREKFIREAQEGHDQKAGDFESHIAGPRRAEKLRQNEKRIRQIRGFRGEGRSLGRGEASYSLSQSGGQAMRQPLSTAVGSSHSCSSESTLSLDGVENRENSQQCRVICIALKLPRETVKREFCVKDKVQILYNWMATLGFPAQDYCIVTVFPKVLLLDRQKTLEDYSIVTDMTLLVEERE